MVSFGKQVPHLLEQFSPLVGVFCLLEPGQRSLKIMFHLPVLAFGHGKDNEKRDHPSPEGVPASISNDFRD
jgi:hypothetical protein